MLNYKIVENNSSSRIGVYILPEIDQER